MSTNEVTANNVGAETKSKVALITGITGQVSAEQSRQTRWPLMNVARALHKYIFFRNFRNR